MPLEVRELVIRALVDPSKSSQHQNNSGANSASPRGGTASASSWEHQQAILDQFSQMLKKKKER